MKHHRRQSLPRHLRVQVLARDEYRCRMCGRPSNVVELQVDHVVAVAGGGTDQLDNLAALCSDCNVGKSAYQFADYRSISIVPANIADHFKFFHDPPTGDKRQYHLILYFKNGVHPGPHDGKFEHTWTIPNTYYDTSSDPKALEHRRREYEQQKFIVKIRLQLVEDGKRLVHNEEGICKVDP